MERVRGAQQQDRLL
jgi:hypothetical protein